MTAEETAEYAIKLSDGMSGPALSAGRALYQLKEEMDAGQRELTRMEAAMKRLTSGSISNVAAVRALQAQITAQRNAVASATARYVELGGTFTEVQRSGNSFGGDLFGLTAKLDAANAAARGSGASMDSLSEAARAMPGPLGAVAGRLSGLRGILAGGPLVAGAMGLAVAFIAVVAASAALVGAVAAATASLLRYGLAQASARREEYLRLEGLMRIRSMYGLAAGSASELQNAIDRVSDSSAMGRSEISGYAEQLYRMGLRGAALEQALDGMAIAGSAGGERLARRFAGLAVGAARMGRSVRAVTDDFRARFGGIAAAQALSFDRQLLRLRQNVARIFDGLKIEPLLRALSQVTSLFSQSTASGRALRHLAELIFQPLIDQAGRGGPIARRFFQGMILGAQRLTILFLRARNFVLRAFGGTDVLAGIDMQSLALRAGTVVVAGFAAAVLLSVGALAAFAGLIALVAANAALLAAPFLAAVAALQVLGVDMIGIGQQMMTGLIAGIRRGGAGLREAILGVAGDSIATLRDALQIRSPSRVFAELGLQIPRGLAAGVESGSGAAMGAVESMVSAPSVGRGRGGASGVSVSFGDVHVHAAPGEGGAGLARDFVDQVVQLLEGVGIELGVEAPSS